MTPQHRPQLVDQRRPRQHQALSGPMQHLQIELGFGLQ